MLQDLLYVRNMTLSGSENEENDQDIWDDRKLNDAYDKALNIANAEVAKRVAMSTNTDPANGSKSKKPAPNPALQKSQKRDKTKWKAGMHCRAVYEEDGIEYEAFIMRVISDKECVVRFLGYENTEIVSLNSLKPSRGKRERNMQIEQALGDDSFSVQSHTAEEMDCSERTQSAGSSIPSKKKKAKKNKPKQTNKFAFPDLPSMPMPNFAHLKNIGAMDMPIPPPPPPTLGLAAHEAEGEDQAVSSMLLSWYMSGYYTGLYQGMKRAREGRKHQ